MKFKYRLPDCWIAKVSAMEEFANGAAQVTVRLKSGDEIHQILISNSMYIVAVRGFGDMPFALKDIVDITQSSVDKSPSKRRIGNIGMTGQFDMRE